MKELDYFNQADLLDDELSINFKKMFYILWNRRYLMLCTFMLILCIFILLTFITAKKYKVEADLYINKTNNSNFAEINPYFIDEMGGISLGSISDKVMMNELELIQSPLVIDNVIKENDLRFKPLFGFIKTKKTGKYITTEKFLKKKIKFENKKGTSVITISYKDKDRELAYDIVNSIIKNYTALHKELNSEKSKFDKKIIEAEYNKVKSNLNKKINSANGLPANSLTGTGNMAALSAFSKSAQQAMSNLKSQYVEGAKSQLSVTEDAQKVAYLSSKLEWANLVEEMSDSSKVVILKVPRLLEEYEHTSPKLLINILLGMVFGCLGSIIVVIYVEKNDSKLSYSKLGDNIIYDLDKEFKQLSTEVISNIKDKKAFIFFEDVPNHITEKFKQFKNTIFLKADISSEFTETINDVDSVVMFARINKTDSETYKLVKKIITNLDKKILYEVLV